MIKDYIDGILNLIKLRGVKIKSSIFNSIISINNHNLLCGGMYVELLDSQTLICIRHFQGHVTPITNLIYPDKSTYFLTSARDRFINVWKTFGKKDRMNICPKYVLLSSNVPKRLACTFHNSKHLILSITQDSKCLIWKINFSNQKMQSSFTPTKKISLKNKPTSLTTFIDINILNYKKVLIVFGLIDEPKYQIILLKNTEKDIILTNKNQFIYTLNKNQNNNQKINVILNPNSDIHEIDNLSIKQNKLLPINQNNFSFKSSQIIAGSIHHILTQAIETKDEILIQQCLQPSKNENKLIRKTVTLLSKKIANELFSYISNNLQKYPRRGPYYISWIENLFLIHNLSLNKTIIRRFEQYVSLRIEYFKPILKLQGMVELLTEQKSKFSNVEKAETIYISE